MRNGTEICTLQKIHISEGSDECSITEDTYIIMSKGIQNAPQINCSTIKDMSKLLRYPLIKLANKLCKKISKHAFDITTRTKEEQLRIVSQRENTNRLKTKT